MALELGRVDQVLAEGLLVADRLGRPVGTTGSGSSPRASAARWAPLALPETAHHRVGRDGGQVAHGAHAEVVQALRRGRAHAPQRLDRGGWRNASSSSGLDQTTPGPGSSPPRLARGLAAREASLATIFERPIPTEQSERELVPHPRRAGRGRSARAARAAAGPR